MEVSRFDIEGPLLLKPRVFPDERGYFFESFNEQTFKTAGIDFYFRQDNQSYSHKNVLRGLHFQHPPFEQGKLVRVVQGSVLDVAVDIRRGSPSFGKHVKVVLRAGEHQLFWIPPGFAHGFLSLEDHTMFLYKCTNTYDKDSESGILWNDPSLDIDWGFSENPLVSPKDLELPSFSALDTRFEMK
ncbi:MAG: dTDP-4-dehydrorhamnose 3,5-epimerase [Bacteroidia bacterium]|nr:dTDP-4-dehydrorhamnose 3,5-epimerase [Bacteroidia bacterium]